MKAFHANLFRAGVVLSILSSALIIPAHANPITLNWMGPLNGAAGGYYLSPYEAQIAGTSNNILLYCIDFNDEVGPPY